jgi:chromosome segregation ATPase
MGIFSPKSKGEMEKLIEENDELKNTLHILQQKSQGVAEVELKLNESKKELIDILKQVDSYKNQIQNYTEETSRKSEKFHELNRIIHELERKKELLRAEIGNLEASSKLSEEKFREIVLKEKEVEELGTKKESLTKEYNNLLNDVEKIREKHADYNHKIDDLKTQEARIIAFLSQYGGNFEESLIKIKETEVELTERLNTLKNEEIKRGSIVKQLEEKINLNEEIKSSLESSLSAIITQLSEKEKLFNEFSSKRDSLLEELRHTQKEYDEFDSKYNFAKDTIQKLETESEELLEKKSSALEELAKFEDVKSELQDKILKLKNEEENLSSLVEGKQKAVEELNKRKIELEENQLKIENNISQIFTKFTDELTLYKNQLSSLSNDITEKDKELESKERILLEKTTQVAEYGGLTKVLQKEKAGIELFISNLKEETRGLTEELLKMKENVNREKLFLTQFKAEAQTYQEKKDMLQKELMQIINHIGQEYSTLTQNKLDIVDEITLRNKELDNLLEQLGSIKANLLELKFETAKMEKQKEEYASKVTELIAMDKNLRSKIVETENEDHLTPESNSSENQE